MEWIFYLLIVYSVVASIFIFLVYRDNQKKYLSFEEIRNIIDPTPIDNSISRKEKADMLLSLLKSRNELTSWYEKSMSTIGVVAFFSMIITTSIQAVNTTKESINNEKIKIEFDQIKEKKEEAEKIINDVTFSLYTRYAKEGILGDKEIRIIKYKLSTLESSKKPDYYAIYQFSMLIKDFKKAADAIELTDKNAVKNLPEKISLAQFYYSLGDIENSRKMVIDIEKQSSEIKSQPYWLLQLSVLKLILELDSEDNIIKELSGMLRLDLNSAKIRIENERNKFLVGISKK